MSHVPALMAAVAFATYAAITGCERSTGDTQVYAWTERGGSYREEITSDPRGEIVERKLWLNGVLIQHCREDEHFRMDCETYDYVAPVLIPDH